MLPRYLCDGMHYPDRVLVHSVYQGREYGEKLGSSRRSIKADLVIEGRSRAAASSWRTMRTRGSTFCPKNSA